MNTLKQFSVIACLVFIAEFAYSTEFVPVYMLSNKRTIEKFPALHKISQDTFRDDILERMTNHPLIVIFAEQTLSPEDFAQHDQKGILFPNLAKLGESFKVAYLPYVQNPIKAIRHLDVAVTELEVENLEDNLEFPETDVLIINLNDVEDSESRIDMLRRHDAAIDRIYRKFIGNNRNILALYTSHHTSWVAPEEVVSSRHARSLLAADIPPTTETKVSTFYNTSNIYMYLDYSQVTFDRNQNATNVTFNYKIENPSNDTILLTMNSAVLLSEVDLVLTFTNGESAGYWELVEPVKVTVTNGSQKDELNITSGAPLYALNGFSYHCGDQVFTNGNFTVFMKDFQLQVFFEKLTENATFKFGDAYDCVGFTSVPIWSGLFVTTILLIIMTLGVTMMMDIRTMDRFDDAKGKTITIIEN